MYAFITILVIIVCVLLGAVVLIQNPKGGGLNATMGGVGQQLLGARRSTDVVEKLTWGFAVALIVLCISTSFFVDKGNIKKTEALPKSEVEQMQMSQPFTGTVPGTATPSATPAQQQPQPQPAAPAQ